MASAELQMIIDMMRANPLLGEMPFADLRAHMEMLVAQATGMLPEGTRCERVTAGGVPAEWIVPAGVSERGAILYLHGGGYCIGSINTHRVLVAHLAIACGVRALAVDYRLAPEHPFPAAVDDATAAYRWLLARDVAPERIVVAGDSAGGGLTVATLVALRDARLPRPAAGVCLSPWVDLEGIGESMTRCAALDPMVQRDGLLRMARAYLGAADPRSPLAAPLYADLRGLPPLLIQVGTAETLLDDSVRLADRARAAGVDVTLEPWDDMIHVWQAFVGLLPEAGQAITRIGEFVRSRLPRT